MHVHREIAVRTCMSATAYVVVRLVVTPRAPGRLCRAGTGGRGRSDPCFSMPGVASARVGMCTPSHPPQGRSEPAIPCGNANRRTGTGMSDQSPRPWPAPVEPPSPRAGNAGAPPLRSGTDRAFPQGTIWTPMRTIGVEGGSQDFSGKLWGVLRQYRVRAAPDQTAVARWAGLYREGQRNHRASLRAADTRP